MSKPLSTSSFAGFVKPFKRQATCRCASLLPTRISAPTSTRTLSTSSTLQDESQQYSNRGRELREGPRWASTPPRMMAPVRSKPPVPNNDFVINSDPELLDKVYNRVLGRGGDIILTEEVKWLAVTHKSFDHGRRGYNDRLAYLGRRIVELQTSLALVQGSSTTDQPPAVDEYGREPFRHPALYGLNDLTEHTKSMITEKKRMAQLAERYGLDSVARWKPKRMTNLQGSGLPIVISQALYAIVGAVALQKGGDAANNIARERILEPLGLN